MNKTARPVLEHRTGQIPRTDREEGRKIMATVQHPHPSGPLGDALARFEAWARQALDNAQMVRGETLDPTSYAGGLADGYADSAAAILATVEAIRAEVLR